MSDDTNRPVVAEFFPKMIAHTLGEPGDGEDAGDDDDSTPSLDDVEINPEIIEAAKEAREEMEEMEGRVLDEWNTELERMLVRAIHQGYDYLDVQIDEFGTPEYVAWMEGHDPEYGMFEEPADRYDLRDTTYEDIRRMHEEHR